MSFIQEIEERASRMENSTIEHDLVILDTYKKVLIAIEAVQPVESLQRLLDESSNEFIGNEFRNYGMETTPKILVEGVLRSYVRIRETLQKSFSSIIWEAEIGDMTLPELLDSDHTANFLWEELEDQCDGIAVSPFELGVG